MGKITSALKKAAEDRIERFDKIARIKVEDNLVIKKMSNSKVDERIVTYFDPKGIITEQYKILRTNVLSLNKSKPLKVLVVTSSVHSEGKSLTALNLAMTLAQSIHRPRVLLIDADLRRGRIAKYLGLKQKFGLSEILTDQVKPSDVLFNIDIENLTFVATGSVPPNPVELLSSDRMKRFLILMKSKFDHIIIDTPPVISVTDAGIIGAQSDGVLMVIQAGRTQRGVVKRASELLHQAHSKVIGHILTNIEYHLPEYIYRYL